MSGTPNTRQAKAGRLWQQGGRCAAAAPTAGRAGRCHINSHPAPSGAGRELRQTITATASSSSGKAFEQVCTAADGRTSSQHPAPTRRHACPALPAGLVVPTTTVISTEKGTATAQALPSEWSVGCGLCGATPWCR